MEVDDKLISTACGYLKPFMTQIIKANETRKEMKSNLTPNHEQQVL